MQVMLCVVSGAGETFKKILLVLYFSVCSDGKVFLRECSVKWEMGDLETYTYLLQCWQAVVITDGEKVMGGKGLMPQQKQATRILTIQQPLWGIISCDSCVGWKSQGIPTAQMRLCFDISMTICGKVVFIFCSAYKEVGMDGRNGLVSCVQWYMPHWQGSSISGSAGHCWLFSLFRFQREGVLLHVRQEGCLGEKVHFLLPRVQVRKHPLCHSCRVHLFAYVQWLFFDAYNQSGYVIFSSVRTPPKDTDGKQGETMIHSGGVEENLQKQLKQSVVVTLAGCIHFRPKALVDGLPPTKTQIAASNCTQRRK